MQLRRQLIVPKTAVDHSKDGGSTFQGRSAVMDCSAGEFEVSWDRNPERLRRENQRWRSVNPEERL